MRAPRARRGPARALLAAFAAGALALGACGRRARPLPPEVVQPLAPGAVVVSEVAQGIQVSWRRPTRTSGGKSLDDLDRLVVERAQGDGPFAVVHEVEVTDQERFRPQMRFEWVDRDATPGVPWRYRVIAETRDGYRSAPGGPVGIVPGKKPGSADGRVPPAAGDR